jgi:peptide/nickel transport system ATP-binding protein
MFFDSILRIAGLAFLCCDHRTDLYRRQFRGPAATDRPLALLDVHDLCVTLHTARGPAPVLRGVSFALAAGSTLGLIGESGCGKSITALALMGLLPERAEVSGSIGFQGEELATLDERAYGALRGNRIGMVFQEPMTALNPLHTIGRQIAEPLRLHRGLPAAAARAEALRLLERVRLPQAAQRLDAYPHQLSGGQRQRVVIAIALACGPDLLIADEPTTALDVTIQREVLDLIAELVREDGMALLLISHDLGVMADSVDQLLVMYGGTVVERGPTQRVFSRMAHPYTRGLFAARPRLGLPRGTRLATIPGRVPELIDLPAGCPFAERCTHAIDECRRELPAMQAVEAGHETRCLRWRDIT